LIRNGAMAATAIAMLVVPPLVAMTRQRGVPMEEAYYHFGRDLAVRMLLTVSMLSCEVMYLRFISTVGHSFYEIRPKRGCQRPKQAGDGNEPPPQSTSRLSEATHAVTNLSSRYSSASWYRQQKSTVTRGLASFILVQSVPNNELLPEPRCPTLIRGER
jgi:hypothetical protein